MLRKLCLIGAVVVTSLILPVQADAGSAVGSLILPVQADTGSDVPRTNPGGKYVHYVVQIPVSSTSIAVLAARFTPIPVVSTFIPVTQHGGRGGSRIASNIAKLPKLLGKG
jgi:hypothetical protein